MTDEELISLVWKYAMDTEMENGPSDLTMLLKTVASRLNMDRWIPIEEKMPPETDSIFARFKGTDKWTPAMFEKKSDNALVIVEFEDGSRTIETAWTTDGEWRFSIRAVPKKVIAWKQYPFHTLPKEVNNGASN